MKQERVTPTDYIKLNKKKEFKVQRETKRLCMKIFISTTQAS
jgi:hypothetical protein